MSRLHCESEDRLHENRRVQAGKEIIDQHAPALWEPLEPACGRWLDDVKNPEEQERAPRRDRDAHKSVGREIALMGKPGRGPEEQGKALAGHFVDNHFARVFFAEAFFREIPEHNADYARDREDREIGRAHV